MAETATKKNETVKPEEKKQADKKPATKDASAKESSKKEETKADMKETKPADAKKAEKKDVTSADKPKEEKPAAPNVKSVTETEGTDQTNAVSENEEKPTEVNKIEEKSGEGKKNEVNEERTMFQLTLPRRIAMYMHPTFNSACRMIEGTVICKSNKSINGWLTIYTGIPEIGKVTGYIRTDSLGWR